MVLGALCHVVAIFKNFVQVLAAEGGGVWRSAAFLGYKLGL